jgi:ribonuclease T1
MKKLKLRIVILICVVSMLLGSCAVPDQDVSNIRIDETGKYTTPQDVAAYIHEYAELPSNFISKKEAAALGWKSNEGNLWDVTDQMSIGGDTFGNREGRLPNAKGRKWYECDVNYAGGYRGAERIVYSNDGLIYYTDDHYETFEQLY